jgi:histidinol-phosphate aminotransferase
MADFRVLAALSFCLIRTLPPRVTLPRKAIEALAAQHPDQLLVIDEAYVDFGAESVVSLVAHA